MPDRELGGYHNANVTTGGGTSLREIDLIISPAAATASAAVEQTFTVPGLLATDRVWSATPTTSPAFGTSAGSIGIPRQSAISTVSIPFANAGTSGAQPTTSATYALLVGSARVIP